MKLATILYGTVTGNAADCAKELGRTLQSSGVPNRVVDMREFAVEELGGLGLVLVVTSTTGHGDPPYNAEGLFHHLHGDRPSLEGLRFAVMAMGSRRFVNFAQCGKDFDAILAELGAERVVERVDCDGYYEDSLDDFQSRLFDYFSASPEQFPDFKIPEPEPEPAPAPAPTPRPSAAKPFPKPPPKPRSLLGRVKARIKRTIRREPRSSEPRHATGKPR